MAAALRLHSADGRRCIWHGNPIRVSPRIALALAMLLHEVATNAIKYGAHSTPHGRVGVTWHITEAEDQHAATGLRLLLRWEERDGPPVQMPTRKGFGSRMIERSLAQELAGEAHLSYEPEGVACALDIPLGAGRGLLQTRGVGEASHRLRLVRVRSERRTPLSRCLGCDTDAGQTRLWLERSGVSSVR